MWGIEGSGFVGEEVETFSAGWVKNCCRVTEEPRSFFAGDMAERCDRSVEVDVFVYEFLLGCFGPADFHV